MMSIKTMQQLNKIQVQMPVQQTEEEPSTYKCTNPKLHKYLGLKCPCYQKNYKTSFGTGALEKNPVDQMKGFPQNLDPFTKASMINGAIQDEPLPDFIPDWEGWTRLIWSPQKFYGDQVGNFNVSVKYGENIAGITIGNGFKKRIQNIVSKTNGLVVNLTSTFKPGVSSMPNGSFMQIDISPPSKQVQFALMSLCQIAGRTDAIRVFINEQIIQVGDFYCGELTRFSGSTFLGTSWCDDDNGGSDTVIKVKRDVGISVIKIEFANLARNPQNGRLVLTDLLLK